jgi:S1-C subfamily serine protease
MRYLLVTLFIAATLCSGEETPRKIPDAILFSSYRISATREDKVLEVGSGTAIDEHHILTANHVIDTEGGTIKVDIFDHDGIYQRSIPCKVVKSDKDIDLALLETEADLPTTRALDYGSAKVGELTVCIGAAWGDAPFSVSMGMFSSKSNAEFKALAQSSATIAPGMSGGAVYNADQKFIGVMVRGAPCVGGLFVPAEAVKRFLELEHR